MRPIRLDLNGFASFREPTTIDFIDADFFALVGPTGSGKSTVIDAMTFALYGSAPRWADRRAVKYGLAPTATRGTVRLIFDADGKRYTVARELRRTKAGVTIRNARLERYVDPEAAGTDDDETEPLAADGEISSAVEKVLGLSFEHFCQCVVLPQGQFSEFLRAKGSDRRAILLKLLGAGVYDRIRSAASQAAALAQSRVTLLDDQLGRLGDISDEALHAAERRVVELTALEEHTTTQLAEISDARAELGIRRDTVGQLTGELSLLSAVTIPVGVEELENQRRSTHTALQAALAALTAAEKADTDARRAITAGPKRAPLERILDDYTKCDGITAKVPALATDIAAAEQELDDVARVRSAAVAVAEQYRVDLEHARTSEQAASSAVDHLCNQQTRLTAIQAPADVADLGAAELDAQNALAAAEAACTAAEDEDSRAAAELNAAPARKPLDAALTKHRERAETVQRQVALTETVTAAQVALDDATARLEAADAKFRSRQAQTAALRHQHTAATLRPLLHVGDTCPVCDQSVSALPPALKAPALEKADASEVAARQDLTGCRAAQATALAAADVQRARLADVETNLAAIDATLDGQPDENEAKQQLKRLDELTERANQAQHAARRARTAVNTARAEATRTHDATTSARTAVRDARESVLGLDPPSVSDVPLAEAWGQLVSWADRHAASVGAALRDAEAAAAAASTARSDVAADLAAAETDAEEARAAETDATSRFRVARHAHEQAKAELARLENGLAGGPSREAVMADLERVAELESAASLAESELLAARTQRDEDQLRAHQVQSAYDRFWSDLNTQRDRLVGLGAPSVDGDSAADAWTTLVAWAEGAAAERVDALATARAEVERAEGAVADLIEALHEDFSATQVDLPDDDPVSVAATRAATAKASGVRDHRELVKRRKEAGKLAADRATAEQNRLVAHELALNLRSDRFPEWLEAAALDVLVADASTSLNELSNDRYSLTHVDGEFYVIDHTDADSERSVRTLSGGETFQASLALALALSSQLTTMAVAGAARLDSIFLDEGFGTLDPDSLDLVAETLENLARGDRMVGVVTHVAALADRIPVRFSVSKDDRSSRVIKETA